MTTRIDRAEASALVIASACISVIQGDPELIEKVRAYAIEQKAPVPPAGISEHSLELADLAVMTMAKRALEGKGQAGRALQEAAEAMAGQGPLHDHQHAAMVIPIPQIDEGAAHSAGALALASFLAEYMHKNPDKTAEFTAWLDGERPDVKAGQYITRERIEAADQMLTMMAHMADQIAQHQIGQHKHAEGDIDLGKLAAEGHQET